MRRVFLAVVTVVSSSAFAGPLNPPAGPITSTNKALADVEPRIAINATNTPGDADSLFRISQPGSYYLTGNITGVTAKHGIELASLNVSIDLNGFALIGVTGSLSGITRNTVDGAVIIRNGLITGWGQSGIALNFANPAGNRGGRIESIVATDNGQGGINVPDGSTVIGCTSLRNLQNGFDVANDAVFTSCVAQGNGNHGFECGFGSTVNACVSRDNLANGFTSGGATSFLNCTSTNNTLSGFDVVRSNIVDCNAAFNLQKGFLLSNGSIQGSTAESNSAGGILVSSNCNVVRNHVLAGTVGIESTGSDNCIDGNHVVDCTTGISITSLGNIILRNTCASNATNYNIVANNRYGAIVNITAGGAAAAVGNAAASTLTSTDPHANFAY